MKNIKKKSIRPEYLAKLNLIVEYIEGHTEEKVTIDQLAKVAFLSPFHLHRIMRALLGEPLGSYIKRTKIERAAKLLEYTTAAIEEVAYHVGYDTPSAFSKQFKMRFKMTPTDYRINKHKDMQVESKTELKIKKPKYVTLEDQQCIYIKMQGDYGQLDYGTAWSTLWTVIKEQKLFTKGIQHVGLSYDDPQVTEASKIRYDACLTVHKEAQPDGEVGVKLLPKGKFLMFHYTGSYRKLGEVYDHIFSNWMMSGEYELRDAPTREIYRNDARRTEESKLKTEIYIPIQ